MTKRKKLLTGSLAMCLVAAVAIGSTLAFMTDSEKATNTLTVGSNLDIDLDEPNWEDSTDGKDMTPGSTEVKDPTIEEVEGSSYMRAIVTIIDTETDEQITDEDRLDLIWQTIRFDSTYQAADNTVGTGLVEGTSYSLEQLESYPTVNPAFTAVPAKATDGQEYYNYNKILNKGEKVALFTNIVIPTDWNQDQLTLLGKFKVEIFAQAIQSQNFASADAAFAALDAEIDAGTMKANYATH